MSTGVQSSWMYLLESVSQRYMCMRECEDKNGGATTVQLTLYHPGFISCDSNHWAHASRGNGCDGFVHMTIYIFHEFAVIALPMGRPYRQYYRALGQHRSNQHQNEQSREKGLFPAASMGIDIREGSSCSKW